MVPQVVNQAPKRKLRARMFFDLASSTTQHRIGLLVLILTKIPLHGFRNRRCRPNAQETAPGFQRQVVLQINFLCVFIFRKTFVAETFQGLSDCLRQEPCMTRTKHLVGRTHNCSGTNMPKRSFVSLTNRLSDPC